ncbi:MAG TPA: transcription antitermination factor NusB [Acidimicrobiales bacterium]|nr:transcription antitermination factor NusB [Acidimicrobiales bacterium]
MVVSTGGRRSARERALELLYESELKEQPVSAILAELPLDPLPYASNLALGVDEHRQRIDDVLVRRAIDWKLDRMPVVDRALLRMATYELGWCPDVPTSVVISEAVELAKEYSTDESSGFVNGMLAAIAHELRPDEQTGSVPRPG